MTRFLVYPVDFAPVVHHAALWCRSPRGAARRMALCSDACQQFRVGCHAPVQARLVLSLISP